MRAGGRSDQLQGTSSAGDESVELELEIDPHQQQARQGQSDELAAAGPPERPAPGARPMSERLEEVLSRYQAEERADFETRRRALQAAGNHEALGQLRERHQINQSYARRAEAVLRAGRADAIEAQYGEIQRRRAALVRDPKKMHDARVGSEGADQAAHQIVLGSPDDRLMRISALLAKRKRSKGSDRFNAVMKWMSTAGIGGDELRRSYELISAGPTLDEDLRAVFGAEPLKFQYLQARLNNQVSKAAELALEVGAIRGGRFIKVEKARVLSLVGSDPAAFRALLDDEPADDFMRAARGALAKHSGHFGEVKALIRAKVPEAGADPQAGGRRRTGYEPTGDRDADYLASLVYNFTKHELRSADKRVVADKVLAWAKTASAPQRARMVEGESAVVYFSERPPDVSNPYTLFWHMAALVWGGARIQYLMSMVEAEDGATEASPQAAGAGRMRRLQAIIDRAKRRGVQKNFKNTTLKWQVSNALSSSAEWDAQQGIAEAYDEDGDPPSFQRGWRALAGHLQQAGMSDDQILQVHRQVRARAAHSGGEAGGEDVEEAREIPVYQKLCKGGDGTGRMRSNFGSGKILDLVATLEPGTLDWTMVREDRDLLDQMKRTIGLEYSPKGGDDLVVPGQVRAANIARWTPIAAILDLRGPDATLDRDDRWTAKSAPRVRRKSQAGVGEALEAEHQSPATLWAGKMLAEYHHETSSKTLLQIAFKAQGAGIDGRALKRAITALSEGDEGPAAWMVKAKKSQLRGSKSAHKHLATYLSGGAIDASMLLDTAAAVTKMGATESAAEFAAEGLDGDQILTMWCGQSFEALKALAKERLVLRIKLMGLAPEAPEAGALQERVQAFNGEIQQHRLAIDRKMARKLEGTVHEGKANEIKRKVEIKLGEHLSGGKAAGLHLTPQETRAKGQQALGAAGVKQQKSLETGVAWDVRSTASTTSSAAMGSHLDALWQTQEQLAQIPVEAPTASPVEDGDLARREVEREALLDKLAQSETKLRDEQKHWKGVQDRLNAKTKKIVMLVVSLIIAAAGLASGIGAAPALIQLAWAMGTAAFTATLDAVIQAAQSRQGEFNADEALRDVVVEVMAGTVGFLITSELTLALDLMAMNQVHRGSVVDQIFGKPALAIVKNEISSIIGDATRGAANRVFAEHPISGLTGDITADLKARIQGLPARSIKTFIGGVAAQSGIQAYNALGFDTHQPTSSAGALFPEDEQVSTAKGQLFDFSNGIDNQAQFVGGPSEHMGRNVWGDTSHTGRDIGRAIKTVFYEEVLLDALKSQTDAALDRMGDRGLAGAQAQGRQMRAAAPEAPAEQAAPAGPQLEVTEPIVAKCLVRLLDERGLTLGATYDTPDAAIEAAVAAIGATGAEAREVRQSLAATVEKIREEARQFVQQANAGEEEEVQLFVEEHD